MEKGVKNNKTELRIKPNKPIHLFIVIMFGGLSIFLGVFGVILSAINNDMISVIIGVIVISASPIVFFSIYLLLRLLTFTTYVFNEKKIVKMRFGKIIYKHKWSEITNPSYWSKSLAGLISVTIDSLMLTFHVVDDDGDIIGKKKKIYMTKKQAEQIKELFCPNLVIESY